MDTTHLTKENPHSKDALVSQSPIVVFKAATVLQSLGVVVSRILLPSGDVAGEKKDRKFESIEQMCEVLNNTLSQAADFVGVPKPQAECEIFTFSTSSL